MPSEAYVSRSGDFEVFTIILSLQARAATIVTSRCALEELSLARQQGQCAPPLFPANSAEF